MMSLFKLVNPKILARLFNINLLLVAYLILTKILTLKTSA